MFCLWNFLSVYTLEDFSIVLKRTKAPYKIYIKTILASSNPWFTLELQGYTLCIEYEFESLLKQETVSAIWKIKELFKLLLICRLEVLISNP